MGNIMADIVDEIEVKPNRIKLVLKWVVAVSGSLIATAFLIGQLKAKHLNRLDRIETNLVKIEIKQTTDFNDVNTRIDKVYDDGLIMFNEFQKHNNQQLNLIIDYGGSNKDMVKRMLEINTLNLESSIKKAKTENLAPLVQELEIEVETNDTVSNLIGATKKIHKLH